MLDIYIYLLVSSGFQNILQREYTSKVYLRGGVYHLLLKQHHKKSFLLQRSQHTRFLQSLFMTLIWGFLVIYPARIICLTSLSVFYEQFYQRGLFRSVIPRTYAVSSFYRVQYLETLNNWFLLRVLANANKKGVTSPTSACKRLPFITPT